MKKRILLTSILLSLIVIVGILASLAFLGCSSQKESASHQQEGQQVAYIDAADKPGVPTSEHDTPMATDAERLEQARYAPVDRSRLLNAAPPTKPDSVQIQPGRELSYPSNLGEITTGSESESIADEVSRGPGGVTYESKYMWRGVDTRGNSATNRPGYGGMGGMGGGTLYGTQPTGPEA